MIVVSGGVSVGPYDVVRAAFAEIGRMELWRVAVQPGKPFAFGVVDRPDGGRTLLFGLPGNPVSKSPGRRAFLRVVAERDDAGAPFRDGLGRVPVRLAGGGRGQGSHVLSALAIAEALAIVPEDVDALPEGAPVDLWWLDRD